MYLYVLVRSSQSSIDYLNTTKDTKDTIQKIMYVEEGRAETRQGKTIYLNITLIRKGNAIKFKGRNRVEIRVRSMTGMEWRGRAGEGRAGVSSYNLYLSQ